MKTGQVRVVLVAVIVSHCTGEKCLPVLCTWSVSSISYQEATLAISWQADRQTDRECLYRGVISQATDKEETFSITIKVSKGRAMIRLENKCMIYTIRLAALIPGRNEVRMVPSISKLSMTCSCSGS